MRRHLCGVSKCVSVLILLLKPSLAQAVTLELNYTDYPASSFGCDFEATDLAERIKATGVKVLSSKCLSEDLTAGSYSLRFRVDRPSDAPLESTYRSGRNFYSNGWYKNYAECEAGLDAQIRAFQIHTGLEPFVAYCSKVNSSYATLPFYPRVEAFGKADMKLVTSKLNVGYLGKIDDQKVIELIEKGSTPGHRSLIYSSVADSSISLGYYSSSDVTISVSLLHRYRTLTECEANIATVESIYQVALNKPVAFFCVDQSSSSAYPGLAMLTGGDPGIRSYGYYRYYNTLSACEKTLPTVVADLQSYGDTILGAVCGYNGSYMPYSFSTE